MTKNTSTKNSLIVFAREPQEGRVKTRLQQDLAADTVLQLYKAFLTDVLSMVSSVSCHKRYLFHAGSVEPIFNLDDSFSQNFVAKPQVEGDLGERMFQAMQLAKADGADGVIIIGTDCVTLSTKNFEEAFGKLIDHDVVLGPSLDGGYYLIGLNDPDLKLFEGIVWGEEQVLADTLKACNRCQKSVHLLEPQNDIDYVSDLDKLCDNPQLNLLAPHTFKILRGKREDGREK